MSTLIALVILLLSFSLQADEVSLLLGRAEAEHAREELIRQAQKGEQLRLSTYLFEMDDFGKETIALLVDAARRGVKVTCIVDGMGRGTNPDMFVKRLPMMKAMEKNGVEVLIYNPPVRRFFDINNRNHIKGLISAKKVIFGDRNISGNYFARGADPHRYISVEAMIEGEEAKVAAQNFDEIRFSDKVKKPLGLYSAQEIAKAESEITKWIALADQEYITPVSLNPIEAKVRYIADSIDLADKPNHGIHHELFDMIAKAKSTVEIMSPYIVMTPEFEAALKKAQGNGAVIKILTNSKATNNVGLVGMAWDLDKEKLLAMGVEIHELQGDYFLHAKTVVVDQQGLYIGSFNMDPRSQNLNLENGAITYNEQLAKIMTRYNRRVSDKFMLPIAKLDLTHASKSERMKHCMKRGLQLFVVELARPYL